MVGVTHSTEVDAAEDRVDAALARVPADRYPALADLLERFVIADERMLDPLPGACPRCGSTDLVEVSVAAPLPWWRRLLGRMPRMVWRLRCEPCDWLISLPIGPVRP